MIALWHVVAVGLVAAGAGFTGGWQVRAWKAGADRADELQVAARDAFRRAERVDVAATAHETARASLQQQDRVLTREIDRVVEKPVYRAKCLDADGLRILSAAIDGDPGAVEPAPALSASAASR